MIALIMNKLMEKKIYSIKKFQRQEFFIEMNFEIKNTFNL